MRYAATCLIGALLMAALSVAVGRFAVSRDTADFFVAVWGVFGVGQIIQFIQAWLQNRRNWRGETSYYFPDQGRKFLEFTIVYPLTVIGGYFLVGALT